MNHPIVWLMILYYPVLFLIFWLTHKLRPSKRTDMALGCAALSFPFIGALIGIGQVIFAAFH
jgi:low temperature requirement protein LtrA